jgi:F-type H+-transporting ATPase subunit a
LNGERMKLNVFGDTTLFHLGVLPVTDTMVMSVAVSLLLVLVAAAFRVALRRHPDGAPAVLAELTVAWLEDLVAGIVEHAEPWLVSFSGSLFLFIAASTVVGQLPGARAPTASLSATSALAVVVFLAVPAAGIRRLGTRGYLRRYLWPNPLMLPLHLLSEVSRTAALALRLFGNMMSGHLIVALLVALAGLLVPMPLMALDLLIGFLQAYIFAILTTVYIGAALRAGEGV